MSAPKKAPDRGAIRGLKQSNSLPDQFDDVSSTRFPCSPQTADDDIAVNDGLKQIGLVKPHNGGFEAFVIVNERLEYVAKATTRANAVRIIAEARR